MNKHSHSTAQTTEIMTQNISSPESPIIPKKPYLHKLVKVPLIPLIYVETPSYITEVIPVYDEELSSSGEYQFSTHASPKINEPGQWTSASYLPRTPP